MIISWYGHSCFKIQTSSASGPLVLVTDPFAKEAGLTPPRLQADIVTVSHQHFDHNNVETVGGSPFLINMPGEYEIKGITVRGIPSFHDKVEGAERGNNIIYCLRVENISLCHLGDLGQEKLTAQQLEQMGDVDILFVPVGGKYTLDGSEAAEIVNQIEPKIVIPMHYKVSGLAIDLDNEKEFLKEIGEAETIDKLTLKKKDLPEDGAPTKVYVMKA